MSQAVSDSGSDSSEDDKRPRRVLKFGGTSVTGFGRLAVIEQVARERMNACDPVLVVSALKGVTDLLTRVASEAVRGTFVPTQEEIVKRHRDAARDLTGNAPDVVEVVDGCLAELDKLLRGIALVGECSPRTLDHVLSFGERLSTTLVAGGLRERGLPARAVDSRELVVTNDRYGEAAVDMAATEERVARGLGADGTLPVVTGFLGATRAGTRTTLGRGGSDYTAAILGAALGAEEVEIWTDVDGVMTADPRIVSDARTLPSISYNELLELSHWGARVVHPKTVRPLRERGIPLVIRNAMDPSRPGTRVSVADGAEANGPIRGIASVDRVSLLQLSGWSGAPRSIAARMLAALDAAGAKVLLVSQASSERSVCVAVHADSLVASRAAVAAEFDLELRAGVLDEPVVEEDCSVVAVVGDGMKARPGVAASVFGVLGHGGVNIRAIAQGSSELNISFVVTRSQVGTAVRATHAAFFGPRIPTAQIFLAGPGRVGKAFLRQLGEVMASGSNHLKLVGIARGRRAVVRPEGIDLTRWSEDLEAGSGDLEGLVEAAVGWPHYPRIFVDCTASSAPAAAYARLLRAGVAVVSANKIGFSSSGVEHEALRRAQHEVGRLYYETTVGAGLPVLRPLADLLATGDRVERIEGILSGTAGFILDEVMKGVTFSEAVKEAHALGYTEPDPRLDLSGTDIARKLVILAREAGIDLDLGEVRVKPLAECGDGGVEAFWERLPSLDAGIAALRDQAQARGGRLVYLARVTREAASVELDIVGPDHPCAAQSGPQNVFVIESRRYKESPLVVRGPGAGPEVTAAGVFADVLRARAEASEIPRRWD
jgi:aspartokinase/homoserine dehydrogenase 1